MLHMQKDISLTPEIPEIIIRPQMPEEEFDYLKYILGRVPFFRKYGYSFEVPDDPEIQSLVELAPNYDGVDWDKLKERFVDTLYDPKFYQTGIQELKTQKSTIEEALPHLAKFNKKWGFKLFPAYNVALTRYGPGGSYGSETGKIIMLTRKNGTFRKERPDHIVVHEMLHIGIEEEIVDYFGLTHREKERVVDRICRQLLSDYKMKDLGDKRIDPFIAQENLADLPAAINKYVEKYPRKDFFQKST